MTPPHPTEADIVEQARIRLLREATASTDRDLLVATRVDVGISRALINTHANRLDALEHKVAQHDAILSKFIGGIVVLNTVFMLIIAFFGNWFGGGA